jgi:hypothetical protein
MIRLIESDRMVFCGALFMKYPESLAQAVESIETYLIVEITARTMMLAERQRFIKMIERGKFLEDDQEALRLLKRTSRIKRWGCHSPIRYPYIASRPRCRNEHLDGGIDAGGGLQGDQRRAFHAQQALVG